MSARTRIVLSTSMEAKLAAIEALLLLIKDTDGVKKITDPIVIAGIIALINMNLQQYRSIACGPANPIDTQTIVAGVPIDPRARTWVLNQLTDSVQVTPILGALWDVSDRAARVLGRLTQPTTLRAGTKVVALIATPEALVAVATTIENSVIVQALRTNTLAVYIGNAATQQVSLLAGDAAIIVIDDLNKIYVRVSVNNEGVSYIGS